MKFCVETWQNMSHKVKEQLINIAQNFFHLLEQFSKLKETECMNILILKNNVESITGSSCGECQLYFYKNLFWSRWKSKILNHENLNKKTLETIIIGIFSTDLDKNEHIIKNFKEEYDL